MISKEFNDPINKINNDTDIITLLLSGGANFAGIQNIFKENRTSGHNHNLGKFKSTYFTTNSYSKFEHT